MKRLAELNEGDFLVYTDVGCVFNPDGLPRLKEYESMLDSNDFGLISFQLPEKLMEYKFTKRSLFEFMKSTDQDKNTQQFMATVVIMKKTPRLENFIKHWYLYACSNNYIYLTDARNPLLKEHPEFMDHRHDQSIYSLMVKKVLNSNIDEKHKPIVLKDETWFDPNWEVDCKKYPIWGRRFRNPIPDYIDS